MTLLGELIREIRFGPVRVKRYTSTPEQIEANIKANAAQKERDDRAAAAYRDKVNANLRTFPLKNGKSIL